MCLFFFLSRPKDVKVDDEGFSDATMKNEASVPVPAPGIIEVRIRLATTHAGESLFGDTVIPVSFPCIN